MKKDLYSKITTEVALPAAEIAADTTTEGETIDRVDNTINTTFVLSTGARTDGTYTPLIEDSENGTDWAVVIDDLLLPASGAEAAAALTEANETKRIGYNGDKRYVRCSIVSASTGTGAVVGVLAILGAVHSPVDQD